MTHIPVFFAIAILSFCGYSYGEEIKMPVGCEGKTYCTLQPESHAALVDDMDRVVKQSRYWAGIGAQNSYFDIQPVPEPSNDNDNCGTTTKVEKPFIIKALVNETNSENKLVVQSKLFEQKIRTTSCLDKGQQCFETLMAQQDDIETSCEERNSTITVYVFEHGKIMPQPFKIPVYCTCKVHFKYTLK